MKKFVIGMLMVGLLVAPAFAAGVYRLPTGQKAEEGATHIVKIDYSDLTTTTSNTAQTLTTLNVDPRMGVEFKSMMLVKPFQILVNTNYTASLALTVGDGTDLDYYLASTEIDEQGTEVYLEFGRDRTTAFGTNTALTTANCATNLALSYFAAVTNVTLTTVNFAESGTNVVTAVTLHTTNVLTAATVQTVAAATAVALQTANGFVGAPKKLYTASDTVDFTFTPNQEGIVNNYTNGEVWIYFRLYDARDLTP